MSKRLLFVDDEAQILEGLRDLLRRQRRDWEMEFALGPEAAIAALADSRFDVVVSDLLMPHVDGVKLLQHVQRSQPHAARMILSGHAEARTALRAASIAHVFLSKPCDADVLRDSVERVCSLQELLHDEELRVAATMPSVLPSPPATYRALSAALEEPETRAEDVAAVLGEDPAMCAKLLQLVNSSFFGVGHEVTDAGEAVDCLGVDTIRTLTVTVAVFAAAEPSTADLDDELATLREHSLLTARLAARLATEQRGDAFMAGMLHDVGKLVLAAHDRPVWDHVVATAAAEGRPMFEVERRERGTDHAVLGAYLLALWGLPFEVVEAVANHHRPREPRFDLRVEDAVRIANLLAAEQHPRGAHSDARHLQGPLASLPAERLVGWRELAAGEAAPMLAAYRERTAP